jgi:hypothetical protein
MGSLLRAYRDNPRQLVSVKDLRTKYRRCLAVPGRQLDIGFFLDLAKRIEAFPAADGACERFFVNHAVLQAISRTKSLTL